MKFVIIVILFIVAGMWLKSRVSPGNSRKSSKVDLKKKLQEKKRVSAIRTLNPLSRSIHPSRPARLPGGIRHGQPAFPVCECAHYRPSGFEDLQLSALASKAAPGNPQFTALSGYQGLLVSILAGAWVG